MSVGVSEARKAVGGVDVSIAMGRIDACVALGIKEGEVEKFSEERGVGNA